MTIWVSYAHLSDEAYFLTAGQAGTWEASLTHAPSSPLFRPQRLSRLVVQAMLWRLLGGEAQARLHRHSSGQLILTDHPHIQVSLSHSQDWVMVGLSDQGPLGVDLEQITADLSDPDVAKDFMSPAEFDRFLSLKPDAQLGFFYQTWTLKEALSKALGIGSILDFSTTEGLQGPDGRVVFSGTGLGLVGQILEGPEGFAAALVAPRESVTGNPVLLNLA